MTIISVGGGHKAFENTYKKFSPSKVKIIFFRILKRIAGFFRFLIHFIG